MGKQTDAAPRPRRKRTARSCPCYLGDDVPVLSVDLSKGPQLSQAGEDLVELKQK